MQTVNIQCNLNCMGKKTPSLDGCICSLNLSDIAMICDMEVMHILLGNLTRSKMAQLSLLMLFQKAIEPWVTCLYQTPSQAHIPLTFVHILLHSCHLYSMTSKTTRFMSLSPPAFRTHIALNHNYHGYFSKILCCQEEVLFRLFFFRLKLSCFFNLFYALTNVRRNFCKQCNSDLCRTVCQRLWFIIVHYDTSVIFIHSRGQQINTHVCTHWSGFSHPKTFRLVANIYFT